MSILNTVRAGLSNVNMSGFINAARDKAVSAGANLKEVALKTKDVALKAIAFTVAFLAAAGRTILSNLRDAKDHIAALPVKGKVGLAAAFGATILGTLYFANKCIQAADNSVVDDSDDDAGSQPDDVTARANNRAAPTVGVPVDVTLVVKPAPTTT